MGIYGSFTLATGMVFDLLDYNLYFFATTTGHTIDFAGHSVPCYALHFDTNGSGYTLQSDIVFSGSTIPPWIYINQYGGGGNVIFDTGGYDIDGGTTLMFQTYSTGTLTLNDSVITAGGMIIGNSNAVSLDAGTSTINILGNHSYSLGIFQIMSTVSVNFYNVSCEEFQMDGGASGITITCNNLTVASTYYAEINNTSNYEVATESDNLVVTGTLSANGLSGNLAYVGGASPYPLIITAAVVSFSYLDVAWCTAAGVASPFHAGAGSVNSGNNTNWIFETNLPFSNSVTYF
jgi:hypothetical protein